MATYIKKIRTDAGDLQIDYNALANLPKYAGSSSAGGAATSANKINTDAGSHIQPVYFANGVPVKTTYTLSRNVPSDAVFTDTHYESKNVVGTPSATSNTTTALTNGGVYLNSVENGVVTSSHKISGTGATTVTSDTSGNIVVNTTYSAATTSAAGLMSVADKKIVNSVSNPNILINGDFQVWQRGTSFSNIENQYTADRWLIKNSKAKTSLVEKSTDVPSGQSMFQSLHIKEATEENSNLRYNFEKALKGTFTLSFWYKTSAAFNTYIYDNNTLKHLGKLATLNSWVKATFTFTATSLTFLSIVHTMSIGDTYITGVKLEVGDSATAFSPRAYAEEVALCQRYFQRVNLYYVPGVSNNSGATATFTYPARLRDMVNSTMTATININTKELRTTDSDAVTTTITLNSATCLGGLIVLTFNSSANLGARKTVWSVGNFEIFADAEVY